MNFIFDVDDTLYDLTQPFRQAMDTLWGDRFDVDAEQLFMLSRQYGDRLFPQIMSGEISLDDAGSERIRLAMKALGKTISVDEAKQFQQCYRQKQYVISLSKPMQDLLDELKANGQTIGILTNGLTTHQQRKIDSLQLTRWVKSEHIFISEAIHASKPERRAFEHVEQTMELTKAETYYIGDSIEHDVRGALAVGWHMIFFNRRRHAIEGLPQQPDAIVTDEVQLADTVKTILTKKA